MGGPRYIARCSYGNDSVATLQLLHEHGLKDVTVVYSDTGWATEEWMERVDRGEEWVRSLGWDHVRIGSKGFEAGVLSHSQTGMFPTRLRKWCTKELKIRPFLAWAKDADPDKRAIVCVGVRRAESEARKDAPAFMPEQDNGRHVWHPLVEFSDADRDAMVLKTPLPLLPHRSDECGICSTLIAPIYVEPRKAISPALRRWKPRSVARCSTLQNTRGPRASARSFVGPTANVANTARPVSGPTCRCLTTSTQARPAKTHGAAHESPTRRPT